jgi:hypothetical protein|tara:strand:- start:306 stop:479 length:174 start_codon:yes stop_codon:yes gene_type:complete
MARIKNFLTPQWLKEFEEMKREVQASSSKRQARRLKRKPKPSSSSEESSVKPETQAS